MEQKVVIHDKINETLNVLINHWCKKILLEMKESILKQYQKNGRGSFDGHIKGIYEVPLSLVDDSIIDENLLSLFSKRGPNKADSFFHPIFILREKSEIVIASGFFKNKKRISEEYALTLSPLAKWALRELKKSAQEQGIFIAKISFSVGGFEARKQVSLDAFLEFPRKMIFDVGEGCVFSREWGILCDRPIEEQSIFSRMHIEYAMPPNAPKTGFHIKV